MEQKILCYRFTICTHIEFEWILQDQELHDFLNCESGRDISPTFVSGCIGIFCQPQGDEIDNDELSLGGIL